MTGNDLNAWLAATKTGRAPRRAFVCPDGFSVSIQASSYHYCSPRDDDGPYTSVELGFPSKVVESLMPYAKEPDQPTGTVYGWVPVDAVADVLTKHGA